MTRNEMLKKLLELSRRFHCYCTIDEYPWNYEQEKQKIIDEWNDLVPMAEKLDISHAEMNHIWQGI